MQLGMATFSTLNYLAINRIFGRGQFPKWMFASNTYSA